MRHGLLRPVLLLAVCILAYAAPPVVAESHDPLYIDLAASPLYARTGFDPAFIGSVPASVYPSWKVVPPAGPFGRTVRPSDLGLEGVPERAFLSLVSFRPMEFTYLIPFQVSARMAGAVGAGGKAAGDGAEAPLIPGMFFAGLGDNWEIYLNGILVKSELHLTPDRSIAVHRSLRDLRFPVDGRLFREGTNVLAVRIVTDPAFVPSGFNQARPYYIGEYSRIERADREIGPMILIGLYLFIGLYHLFMFLVRPSDRHNLFYGLFSVDLGVYLLMRTYAIATVIADSDVVFRIELFTLSLILPLVGAFLETLNESRIRKVTLWYGGFCSIIAVGELLAPKPFARDLLLIWQVSGLVMAVFYFGVDMLGRFLADLRKRRADESGREGSPSLGKIYLESLVRTPVGNLLIGGAILFATGIFDIVDAMVMQWDLLLTKYGFFLFTMGTALVLANRLGFLHDRLGDLNRSLEERIGVMTETGVRLSASERRYRSLFEGSSDPVALLTEELDFIEGNRAATELFGLDSHDWGSFNLTQAVYADEREGSLPAEYLRAAARSLKDKVEASEIMVRIKAPIGDPRPCALRLERIDALERREILLRVAPETDDPLADSFVEARERFDIESSLTAADRVCRRATAYLATYTGRVESRFLASCLREIVVNAVEHGSLEISFDEKSESMRAGGYFELLRERRADPRFRSRKVAVEYSISSNRVVFRVTDEGPGFDYKEFIRGGDVPAEELLEHGRGLFITMRAFDKVLFNERGNQVTLVKDFGTLQGSGRTH